MIVRLGLRRARFLASLVGLLLVASPAAGQSVDEAEYIELFERVFGHRPPDVSQRVEAQLRIDRHRAGTIPVLVPLHGSGIRIGAEPLLIAMQEILLPEALERVGAAADEDGSISGDALRALGIESSFSERRQQLQLKTPIAMRAVTILSVQDRGARRGKPIRPARISGYLNTQTRAIIGSPRSRVFEDLETVTNVQGWVLHSGATIDNGRAQLFQLDTLEAHRDDLGRELRYTAGTVSALAFAPAYPENVMGMGVASTSTLDFYERASPSIVEDFVLERHARAEVRINRALVQTFQLEPGRYSLRDFPLRGGSNRVEVRVLDGDHVLRRFQRDLTWENELLYRGEQQISAVVGVPMATGDVTRLAEPENTLASGLYRYGFRDWLSAGGSARVNRRRQELSTGALMGSDYGLFELAGAMTHWQGNALQWSGLLGVRNYASLHWSRWIRSYGASLRAESPRFAQRGPVVPGSERALSSSAYADVLLGRRSSGHFRLFYDANRNGRFHAVGTSLTLLSRVSRELELQLTGDWRRDRLANHTWFLTFRITHFPNSIGSRTQVDFTTPDDVVGVDWSYRRSLVDEVRARLRYDDRETTAVGAQMREGNWRWAANADRYADRQGFSGRFGYAGPRGRFRTQYGYREAASRLQGEQHATEISADTAVAFADGQLALTRPVSNGFVILRPNPDFEHSRMRFSHNAVSDLLGPGVAPGLRPLKANTISVLEAEIPAGAWIDDRVRSVTPLPDTGYLVTVGEGGGVLAEGLLLDARGRPLAYASGMLLPADETLEPEPFFTGDDGRFSLIDVDQGRYRIRLRDGRVVAEFEIPADAGDLYDIGVISVGDAADEPTQTR